MSRPAKNRKREFFGSGWYAAPNWLNDDFPTPEYVQVFVYPEDPEDTRRLYLDKNETLVMGCFFRNAGDKGKCAMGLKPLSAGSRLSRNSVIRTLPLLLDKALITKDLNAGEDTVYGINMDTARLWGQAFEAQMTDVLAEKKKRRRPENYTHHGHSSENGTQDNPTHHGTGVYPPRADSVPTMGIHPTHHGQTLLSTTSTTEEQQYEDPGTDAAALSEDKWKWELVEELISLDIKKPDALRLTAPGGSVLQKIRDHIDMFHAENKRLRESGRAECLPGWIVAGVNTPGGYQKRKHKQKEETFVPVYRLAAKGDSLISGEGSHNGWYFAWGAPYTQYYRPYHTVRTLEDIKVHHQDDEAIHKNNYDDGDLVALEIGKIRFVNGRKQEVA